MTGECLFACSLEFHRTLKINARTLSDVVTRVRLCGHHTHRGLCCEVHVYGAVMWRGDIAACMLVCWDFIYTLEIITRTLREVVNRERLCSTNSFYFGCFRNLRGLVCLFVCWYKTRKSILRSLCPEGSNNPWE